MSRVSLLTLAKLNKRIITILILIANSADISSTIYDSLKVEHLERCVKNQTVTLLINLLYFIN